MKSMSKRSITMLAGGSIAAFGMGVMVRGAWLAWRPGGWLLAGVFITLPAIFAAYGAFRGK